ncbi:hypothetical protein FIBSPDRAFT_258477 [Athelia psychrophila]|uniref:Uncharacterized protein n=1 Tax=Athelia psychrophila TaxID=1759441 RepID=A0A166RM81_9AGAM|nr:hypothetical protein FIBSPDRAFT_258477 [Fibularhizoctonia sp. CBS 109695]
MVKRTATPPPGDDEPKYLTVVHPYPLHAHMELPKDREDFGRWVACAMGDPDPFYAFFHKPSAPSMVIIEVKRDWDGFDHLLGEHKWSEVLRNPSHEEEAKVTQVFYCRYNTGRNVQKHGWKRIDAQESWFKGFSPKNNVITFPYPDTSYCTPPQEDKTNEPLCRPIPASSRFPALPTVAATPAARAAPPGSAGWVTQKAAPVQNRKASTRGPRGRGTPASLQIQPSSRGGAKSASAMTSDAGSHSPWNQISRGPSSAFPSSKQSASEKKNPWTRLPSLKSSSSETSTSTGESSVFNVPLPVFDVPTPPGISVNPVSWADDIPTGLFPNVVVSNAQSTLPPLSSNAAAPQSTRHAKVNDGQYLEDAFEQLGVADPMEDYAPTWELEGAQSVKGATPTMQPAVSDTNLWDDWKEPQPAAEMLCTDHGKICKKGICKTYYKQLKDIERAKKDAEREENEAKKKGKGKGKGKRGQGKRITHFSMQEATALIGL